MISTVGKVGGIPSQAPYPDIPGYSLLGAAAPKTPQKGW